MAWQHTVILQTLSCHMNIQRDKQFQRVSLFQSAEHTDWHHQWEVPGLPVFSLWLNVGRKVAVLFQRFPQLYFQASCLARNSHGSGAGLSWEGTYHLLSAEQGMKTNCYLGWCTHHTVGHPKVLQSLCSSGTQFLLILDRQPRREQSWNLQGHVWCAQGSWSSRKLCPILLSVHTKIQHEGTISL